MNAQIDIKAAHRQDFINAMRSVASSVSVVTTDGEAGRHGATVSAFCSVSADPPTLLVCLNSGSRIAQTVAANGQFAVNVLPETERATAERFAGWRDQDDRFQGADWHEGDCPALNGATVFFCTVEETSIAGSHHVFFGRVEAIQEGRARPLTYFDGAFHRVELLRIDEGEA